MDKIKMLVEMLESWHDVVRGKFSVVEEEWFLEIYERMRDIVRSDNK
jgi:hypothetical protein